MNTRSTSFILGLILALTVSATLHAQSGASAPSRSSATAADPAPSGQAPDDATKKVTELVHAGKYSEAQQLTAGLLIAYPNDQRLVRAKALIEKLLSPAGPENTPQANNQPTAPVMNANAAPLGGMDKVDYNSLIDLARQAQQTTDLAEQTTLLKQFMDQSELFVKKHPDQMLLWQLRAASAISLNEPMEGYSAGQKLIASCAADSNDPGIQRLLAQLNNKGWLDKYRAEQAARQAKEWILGNWSMHYSWADERGGGTDSGDGSEDFTQTGTSIEGYYTDSDGMRSKTPNARATILDSGEIRWRSHFSSYEISDNNRTMKIVFTAPNGNKGEQTTTWLLHKR